MKTAPAIGAEIVPLKAEDGLRRHGRLSAKKITLAHGGGGSAMRDIIDDVFISAFENPAMGDLEDQARLPLSLVETLRAVVLEMGDNPDGAAILHSANRAARRHGQAGFRAVSDGDYQVYQEFFRKTLIKDSP